MIKNFLSLLFFLLVVPVIAYADKQAVDVVACVNLANGYPTEIDGEPWELTQAILEIPYDHERVRLAPDYHLVGGRKLGWHGTWAAFLHLGSDGWMVFETRAEDDRLDVFAASFVPTVVVEAFEACGVKWGGYWTADYPIVVLEPPPQPQPEFFRLPADALSNGAGLLPPIADQD